MKKIIIALFASFAALAAFAADAEKPWKYTDARELRIINKGFDNTEHPYWRLPTVCAPTSGAASSALRA